MTAEPPVRPVPSQSVVVPGPGRSRPVGPTALVVDDDAVGRRSTRAALEAAGWQVLMSDGPVQARVLHDLHGPDLVVTDVWMEHGDGLTLLAQLSADGWRTPAVVVTGDVSPDVLDRAAALGVCGVLAKPVDPLALQALVGGRLPAAEEAQDLLPDQVRVVLDRPDWRTDRRSG